MAGDLWKSYCERRGFDASEFRCLISDLNLGWRSRRVFSSGSGVPLVSSAFKCSAAALPSRLGVRFGASTVGVALASSSAPQSSRPQPKIPPHPLPPPVNPPETVNPDPVTLREQWSYATRLYSRWYAHAWGTAILAGLSFYAIGWLVKGENPVSSGTDDKKQET